MYAQDFGERFPTVGAPRGEGGIASLELIYDKYLSDPNLFVCPSDEFVSRWDGKGRLDAAHCSYGYDHAHTGNHPPDVAIVADCTGIQDSTDGLPTCHFHPETAMAISPRGNGLNILYVDGHVKWAIERDRGRKGDDIYTKSETLPPEEDSWITQ